MSPSARIPASTKALVLRKASSVSKPVLHDAVLEDQPIPKLKPGEILVKVHAAAFNHRDVRTVNSGERGV